MERIIRYEGKDWFKLKNELFKIKGVEKITLLPQREDSVKFRDKGFMRIKGTFDSYYLNALKKSYSIEIK